MYADGVIAASEEERVSLRGWPMEAHRHAWSEMEKERGRLEDVLVLLNGCVVLLLLDKDYVRARSGGAQRGRGEGGVVSSRLRLSPKETTMEARTLHPDSHAFRKLFGRGRLDDSKLQRGEGHDDWRREGEGRKGEEIVVGRRPACGELDFISGRPAAGDHVWARASHCERRPR